jgi:hypothetical protein
MRFPDDEIPEISDIPVQNKYPDLIGNFARQANTGDP